MQPTILNNANCPYCGIDLTPENISREHVVGRRFVPKSKLHAQWNLILNACKPCNGRKADLEDDISAITLLPHGSGDPILSQEVAHKASRSKSRRTQKPVADSHEQLTVGGNMMQAVKVSFGLTAPPQIEEGRAFELARLHLSAFFYMQTYNAETRRGGFWLHGFDPVAVAGRHDWGNAVFTAFMQTVETWPHRLIANTAEGFFKVMTRKHPTAECWAWAIEWNQSMRVIGFFGERQPAQDIVDSFPELEMRMIESTPQRTLRFREEVPLADDQDTLFADPQAMALDR